MALGYQWVETDAHVTSDGVCLAFHDDRLDRVTDQVGIVGELPYSKVKTEVQLVREKGTWRVVSEDLQVRIGEG